MMKAALKFVWNISGTKAMNVKVFSPKIRRPRKVENSLENKHTKKFFLSKVKEKVSVCHAFIL